MKKPYSIGLDIGTNSVGWAVVMEDYKVPSKKMKVLGNTDKQSIKKNLIGALLFDSGETAVERRLNRTTSRRYDRRRNRIRYLQHIFAEEMNRADENFFHRLKESFFVEEDKTYSKYPIFGTLEEEKNYHKNYPTIYHLRKTLADTPDKMDIRLIYLALAHIIKYRGHFLIEGDLDIENIGIQDSFKSFIEEYNTQFGTKLDSTTKVEAIFTENSSKAKRVETILGLFPDETAAGNLDKFLKLMLGNQADFKKVFDLEEKITLQFSKDSYEEDLELLLSKIDEEYAALFDLAKKVYDAVLLSNILTVKEKNTKAPLSASMIKRYEEHKDDLKAFKRFFRERLPEKYETMFKDLTKPSYAAYVSGLYKKDAKRGLVPTSKRVTEDDFYKFSKGLLIDVEGAEYFLEKIEREDFLRKQRTFDNGAIPNQVHVKELQAIILNQSKYYPFLAENKEKIEKILTFRIPYYVGPLARGNSSFAWLQRKSDEAIRPWNFEQVVDMETSASRFIERMTLHDLYLPDEKVLPRHSLIYEKYTVFNELTKVRFTPEGGKEVYFSKTDKENIFDSLFKRYRKVTKRKLKDFIEKELGYGYIDIDNIKGVEEQFNASYTTYQDLLKIIGDKEFLDNEENKDLLEEIIYILTVFEDRKMIEKRLSELNIPFENKIIKKLARKKYTGWGNLSRKLIDGIRNRETNRTILGHLIDDGFSNRNLMQLINDDGLDFKEIIRKAQTIENIDTNQALVSSLPGSPAIKKGILQSLNIVDEIIAIMGYAPTNIVIEMARENQTTQKGRDNSAQRLKKIEDGIKLLGSDLLKQNPIQDNKDLQKEKLFLYYMQNGIDLYTGQPLNCDPDSLAFYDVDHIVPRSYIKNDSFDNKVLTTSKGNRKKLDDVPAKEVVEKMENTWRRLHAAGLISDIKLSYLMKGELTEEDKAGFIRRQLVETRQITKHVARLLDEKLNRKKNENGEKLRTTKIITLKSVFASRFRANFDLYKLRELNHYHHAHDAYLNAVVAQALLKVYPKFERELVYGSYVKESIFSRKISATERMRMYNNILKFISKDKKVDQETGEIVWDKKEIENIVKKVIYSSPVNIVKKREEQSGALFKQSNMAVGYNNKLIPRKKDWSVDKYGGFIEPAESYSLAIFYTDINGKKPKKKSTIIAISRMEKKDYEKEPERFLAQKGFERVEKTIKLPKYSLFEMEKGRRRLLASSGELQKGNQVLLPEHLIRLLSYAKKVDVLVKSKDDDYDLEEHRAEFAELLDCIKKFNDMYILASSNMSKIEEIYQKNIDAPIEEVARSFVALLNFTMMGAATDFKFFGQIIPRKRYPSTTECLKSTLIHQSVTGLYETRIDLSKLGEN
ncbi:type II CRISPR RNA-guided endonuclease Cas9 [Streptococcus massiliensis]|uniref:CRISPR-associated endonuclease Cas9 n=1 Tax=Streptococcus massiliensis TaxID=313439 RepID=A0A380KY08_9STRE|nr:type II CRISPR RNA-guided endonuclease Cas9 [Streptococcus massiliensis]SUN76159.1 CRISPR-associated protein csn1 [Streptococcus massiliensis]